MNMNNFKKMISKAVALAAVCVLTVGLTACGAKKKTVTVEVTDNTGATSSYTVKTDAEFLIDVFDDTKDITIDGTQEDWGFYLTTVNGVEASYDVDGSYWSIYVNGEYGNFGVDQQPVEDGDTYSFVYEVYSEDAVG